MLGVAGLAAALLVAQGCARKTPQEDASGTAQALLAAAWSGDAKAFDATIDRPAVRADLRRQLMAVAQANMLAVEGGASDAALDRMITPDALRLAQAETGQPLAAAPTKAQAAALLAPAGKDRVCLRGAPDQAGCVLTFGREAAGWRLIGMAPAGFTVRLARPPPPKTTS
jgi:hypothetical protein